MKILNTSNASRSTPLFLVNWSDERRYCFANDWMHLKKKKKKVIIRAENWLLILLQTLSSSIAKIMQLKSQLRGLKEEGDTIKDYVVKVKNLVSS